MMGLKDDIFYLSWFITYFIQVLPKHIKVQVLPVDLICVSASVLIVPWGWDANPSGFSPLSCVKCCENNYFFLFETVMSRITVTNLFWNILVITRLFLWHFVVNSDPCVLTSKFLWTDMTPLKSNCSNNWDFCFTRTLIVKLLSPIHSFEFGYLNLVKFCTYLFDW